MINLNEIYKYYLILKEQFLEILKNCIYKILIINFIFRETIIDFEGNKI
jgi:hypothetical protein